MTNHVNEFSEKLAMALGLILDQSSSPLRIGKNLRMCGDCHNATKFLSRIIGKDVIVRDANRFHTFHNGSCSCKDHF
jgi:hypothetical protein